MQLIHAYQFLCFLAKMALNAENTYMRYQFLCFLAKMAAKQAPLNLPLHIVLHDFAIGACMHMHADTSYK